MSEGTNHIVSPKLYVGIWLGLIALTWITYFAARVNMEAASGPLHGIPFNAVVALLIACTKASLVVLFFMHGLYSSRLVKTVIIAGFFWLMILLGLTIQDYLARSAYYR